MYLLIGNLSNSTLRPKCVGVFFSESDDSNGIFWRNDDSAVFQVGFYFFETHQNLVLQTSYSLDYPVKLTHFFQILTEKSFVIIS